MLKCCSTKIYDGEAKLKFGNLEIKNYAVLAPMAGVTDRAMREISMEFNAGACMTELISSNGIVFGDRKTLSYLDSSKETSPLGVQIFGYSPEIMAEATKKLMQIKPDFIDINMGCPAPKIVKSGSGSALLKDVDKAVEIAKAVVTSSDVPVTVKTRLGFDKNNIVCIELGKMLEDAGVSAITLHARTSKQMYSGKADYEYIKALKENVKIPVIGNGDIFSAKDAQYMKKYTNCDLVAVGRGAMGNPWIFRDIKNLSENKPINPVSISEKMEVMIKHLEKLFEYKGPIIGLKEGRRQASYYIRDFNNATYFRKKIFSTASLDEIINLAKEIKNQIKESDDE